jgi:hypothetical protein
MSYSLRSRNKGKGPEIGSEFRQLAMSLSAARPDEGSIANTPSNVAVASTGSSMTLPPYTMEASSAGPSAWGNNVTTGSRVTESETSTASAAPMLQITLPDLYYVSPLNPHPGILFRQSVDRMDPIQDILRPAFNPFDHLPGRLRTHSLDEHLRATGHHAVEAVVRSQSLEPVVSAPQPLVFDVKHMSSTSPVMTLAENELEKAVPNVEAFIDSAQLAVIVEGSGKKAKRVRLPPRGFGRSPWPEYNRPTPEECAEVHRLLTEAHGESVRPEVLVGMSLPTCLFCISGTANCYVFPVDNEVPGCGEVPDVLDALCRTVLALNTTTKNSGKLCANKYLAQI